MSAEPRHPHDVLLAEAASVFYLLGGVGSQHVILIGGLVPPLLAPDAAESHIGSGDIDLCLSVAITEGDTRAYYDSIQKLIEPFFEPDSANGGRWRKRADAAGVPLLLDFLAPARPDEMPLADGTREVDEPRAVENAGTSLRPFLIRSGSLVDADAVTLELKRVPIVHRHGALADVTIRYAGPVGFFAAKADALTGRDDPKDGYDLAWVCLHARQSPAEVAALLIEREAFRHPDFPERVAQIREKFQSPRDVGPDGFASETHPGLGPGDALFDQARNAAYLAVMGVTDALVAALWA